MKPYPSLVSGALRSRLYIHLLVVLAVQAIFCSASWSLDTRPQLPKDHGSEDRLLERIDFGNAYIRGQTIQSGAVYLLQRKKSDIQSLLKPRENYREEILKDFHVPEKQAIPMKVKD